MKAVFGYVLSFVLGVVVTAILIAVFFGGSHPKFGLSDNSVSLSTKYFKLQHSELCAELASDGCSCVPYVQTEQRCEATMDIFVSTKYRALLDEKHKNSQSTE